MTTRDMTIDEHIEQKKDEKWQIGWKYLYDQFLDEYKNGDFEWLPPSTPIEIARRGAVIFADRSWDILVWYINEALGHMYEEEYAYTQADMEDLGLVPKEDN